MNGVTIFNNKQFGQIRTIAQNGEVWFVAKDVALALGYEKARNAIAQHVDKDDALKQGVADSLGRMQETTLINESGMYALIFGSKLEKARQFKHWVTSEVLPTIRKTGTYTVTNTDDYKARMLAVKEQNAKIRTAQLMFKIAEKTSTKYKEVLQSRITQMLTGECLLPLPTVEERTLSATEIGERLGISAHKVGTLANAHNLKTDKYGKWFYDKAKTADKQVETFRYYEKSVEVFRSLLEVAV